MEKYVTDFYQKSLAYTNIENGLYKIYDVKKGLRNEDGTGVCVGLTKIADVVGYTHENNKKIDAQGQLFYRGINVYDLIKGHQNKNSVYGFEETCFLLLFGFLPTKEELQEFRIALESRYELPDEFLEMNIMRKPSHNLMNQLQQAVLLLYSFDNQPDDTSVMNTLRQGLDIMAKLPSIICYAYHSKVHHYKKESLHIHYPKYEYSIAENILHMLRPDSGFTKKEAKILDLMFILHADHGGGNNSTFANVVVSSTGTDIYSSTVASIGSLKGPRHGGANIQVNRMMKEVIKELGYCKDVGKIKDLQRRMLQKNFFDHSGLIYGIGHAIYTLSDPRAELLKEHGLALAVEKNREEEFAFYRLFEACAKEVMFEEKGIHVSSNVDFYSGLIYDMLDIPKDIYTPLFVCARMVGWLAHNIENKMFDGRIMRPATKYVGTMQNYKDIEER